ncbi:MAG TPA: hypothetical protein VD769_09935 [Gaiellaceae bacterium]|nr:hypothetical protein [Gaiellaceae bacterium]
MPTARRRQTTSTGIDLPHLDEHDRVEPRRPGIIGVVVSDPERPSVRFDPLQPVSRARLIARLVYGPLLWLVALVAVAWVVTHRWAIQVGLVVTFASFLVALALLALLRAGRRREERRYVARG